MKNNFSVFQIVCDNDIKLLFDIKLKHTPQIGETFSYIDLPKGIKVQLKVRDIIYPVIPTDKKNDTPVVEEYTKILPMIVVEYLYEQSIADIL